MANDTEAQRPHISNIIRKNFYVDDCLMGANSVQELCDNYYDLTHTLSENGFHLRKWATNSEKLKNIIPSGNLEKCGTDNRVKTLGLVWNTDTDKLGANVSVLIDVHKPTKIKRQLLSQIASLSDPLGWLAPCIIKAKILMQEVWLLKKDWDDVLPTEITDIWNKMKSELNEINTINIPRWMHTTESSINELVGFCDASSKAYAAAVYVRCINGEKISVMLITAKYRVAPIKTLTIPRLELSAAYLLSQLMKKVIDSTQTHFHNIYNFTDSKIVLDWIKGNPNRWKTFVATRVTKINKNTTANSWYHVPTDLNPADCASRGIFPSELERNQMWWHGPDFLHTKSIRFPTTDTSIDDVASSIFSEQKTAVVALNATIEPDIIPSASSYFKLKK